VLRRHIAHRVAAKHSRQTAPCETGCGIINKVSGDRHLEPLPSRQTCKLSAAAPARGMSVLRGSLPLTASGGLAQQAAAGVIYRLAPISCWHHANRLDGRAHTYSYEEHDASGCLRRKRAAQKGERLLRLHMPSTALTPACLFSALLPPACDRASNGIIH